MRVGCCVWRRGHWELSTHSYREEGMEGRVACMNPRRGGGRGEVEMKSKRDLLKYGNAFGHMKEKNVRGRRISRLRRTCGGKNGRGRTGGKNREIRSNNRGEGRRKTGGGREHERGGKERKTLRWGGEKNYRI